MRIWFYEDPDSGEPHIFRHNVLEDEVIEVVESPVVEYSGQGDVRVALGQTSVGRFLKVVFKIMDDESRFIITAYDLSAGAKRALRRNMKKRKR